MRIAEKEIKLKDGRSAVLRSPGRADAFALYDLRRATSEETYFMARYPEEMVFSREGMVERIEAAEEDPMNVSLAIFLGQTMIAAAEVQRYRDHLKYRHRAGFGISIRKDFWGQGLGSLLLAEAIRLAHENGFEQLELGVFEDNSRAIHLYEKMGFRKVGIQPRACKLKDRTYRDEVRMVLFL